MSNYIEIQLFIVEMNLSMYTKELNYLCVQTLLGHFPAKSRRPFLYSKYMLVLLSFTYVLESFGPLSIALQRNCFRLIKYFAFQASRHSTESGTSAINCSALMARCDQKQSINTYLKHFCTKYYCVNPAFSALTWLSVDLSKDVGMLGSHSLSTHAKNIRLDRRGISVRKHLSPKFQIILNFKFNSWKWNWACRSINWMNLRV